MSAPVEELRVAATKLRETAARATPGPWAVSRIPGIGQTVDDPEGRLCVPVGTQWISTADGAWIALASPALAESIADLLDGVADVVDEHDPEDGCGCTRSDSFHPALRLARAINGGAS